VGNEAILARLVFYHRLNKEAMLRKAGWYVGFSAEAGNIYFAGEPISIDSLLGSGSVFFGAGTPLGPILLGYGYTEGGQDRFFLLIGRNFLSSRRRSLGSF
jgi:NTE family protein